MIRPGLMLYGIYPDPGLESLAAVYPILSFKSRIVFLKQLQKGESAGYGREYIAKESAQLAILPIGYSHSIP
jgi:alanine racemase